MLKKYSNIKTKNLYNKIVNFFIKDGNKVKASKIVSLAFLKVSKKNRAVFRRDFIETIYKIEQFR